MGSVMRPYLCVCAQRGTVGYPGPGSAPGCSGCDGCAVRNDVGACVAGRCRGVEARFTGRDARQALMFGPETYQGHYGDAFKLRFPDYSSSQNVYTAQIALDHCVSVEEANAPLVLVGDAYTPYFRVYRSALPTCPEPRPPHVSPAVAGRPGCGCGAPCTA